MSVAFALGTQSDKLCRNRRYVRRYKAAGNDRVAVVSDMSLIRLRVEGFAKGDSEKRVSQNSARGGFPPATGLDRSRKLSRECAVFLERA